MFLARIQGQKDRQGQKDKDRDRDILYHRMLIPMIETKKIETEKSHLAAQKSRDHPGLNQKSNLF